MRPCRAEGGQVLYLQEGGTLLSMHPVVNTAMGCSFPQTLRQHTIVEVKALNGSPEREAVEAGAIYVCGKNSAGGSEVKVRFAQSPPLSPKKLGDCPSNNGRL